MRVALRIVRKGESDGSSRFVLNPLGDRHRAQSMLRVDPIDVGDKLVR
jgi:hypothetical protein